MDYATFANESETVRHIEGMKGWDAEAIQLCLPNDPNADDEGNAWVIQCNGGMFLRQDGYVR